MRVGEAIWMPGLFAVLALVLVACGGSDPTATALPTSTASPTATPVSQQESSELSAEEEAYLGAVRDAQLLTIGIFQGFGQVFSQTYPVREALLAALLENGIGTPFIGNLAALEELDPPDRFREDHRIWLEATRESLRLDTEAADAVRDGDLVKFAHLNGDLAETSVRARLALTPVFCQSIAADPRAAAICAEEGSVLNAQYAVRLNNLLREFMPGIESASNTVAFRLSLTPEEIGQVLSSMGTGSRNIFQEIESALGTMTPPEELLADHERLQTYIGEVLAIIEEVNRLREDGDLNAARLKLQGLDQPFCEARRSFESSDFKEAVAVFFTGGPDACGGTPY